VRPELVPIFVQRLSSEPVMKGRQFASLRISLPQQTTSVVKPAGNLLYLDFILQSSAEQGKRE
jgi:hypothetical protein